MSSICRGGFVENAWRKDLCSNCFRTREEHGDEMTSGFYQQPWAVQGPSVAIHVKSPTPPSASVYGLPLSPPQTKVLSSASRYQSPSIGTGINHIGNSNNMRTASATSGTSRYAFSNNTNTPVGGSRNTAHYSDRVSPARSTSSNGINVTVNGTSNSNIKKYVQQHPPQAAVRTSIPSVMNNNSNGRIHANNLPGGGVSVSVGRSSSYSSQLNTVGTSGRSSGSSSGLPQPSGSNYTNNQTTTTHHHQHQQRRTAHQLPQPPTHSHQQNIHHHHHTQNHPSHKSSSVPILTQSRNLLQTNNNHSNGQNFAKQLLLTSESKENRRLMDTPDGEVIQVKTMGTGGQGVSHSSGYGTVSSHSMTKTGKGILRREGQKRKMSVSFPQEVCAVIGYGGEVNGGSSDEDSDEEVPPDPLDSSPISEILDKSATSPLEKELNRVTVKNTNFNSIKTNLLGYAPIEIGPIVGGTGGKSKPLVCIGTFDARKEPLRVLRKAGDENGTSLSKNVKGPISKMVTNSFLKSKVPSASAIRETEKTKTTNPNHGLELRRNGVIPAAFMQQNNNHQHQQPIGSDNRVPIQKGKGNEVPPPSTLYMEKCTQHKETAQLIQSLTIESRPSVDTIITPESTQETIQNTNSGQSIGTSNLTPDGNIATKRNSFLRDIFNEEIDSVDFSIETDTCKNIELRLPFVSLSHDSLEPPPPRIIKSELKLEISPATNLYQKQHYEDDSLEADSGVDTKTTNQVRTSETSESDTEKSGSNSDSGNENDFMKKLTSRVGLFVSIDQEDSDETHAGLGNVSKTAKLSPDSVISSEMSSTSPTDSSGSNESIPTKIQEELEQESTIVAPSRIGNLIPPMLKRAAPLPPVTFASQPLPFSPYPHEEIYDDVHITTNGRNEPAEEESLYDDCSTIGTGRIVKGSYDFGDSEGVIDPDFGEGVPLKQHEGIEFLGIRRIDSESFLKQQSPPPLSPQAKGSPNGKKSRSGSESPKPKRRVNQFFSTIGKKAGAAFNRSSNQNQVMLDLSPTKSSSMKTSSQSFSPYKRSMSQDEVSMARTQEIYATLTPTSLKLRGLAPMLNKLSKLELQYRDSKEDSPEKKKNKFSNSIKRFLGFGTPNPKESSDENDGMSREQCTDGERRSKSPSPIRHELSAYVPSACPLTRPPPPPPRVHSLDTDTLTKSGTMSVKPVRPPPPKTNQVAPSFTSVFASQEDGQVDDHVHVHNPPNKPRRKASMSRGSDDSGAYTANYLETTYNHITSLNFETLKLIASQTPANIKRASDQLLKLNKNPLRWSQFYLTDVESLAFGKGFAFFSAFWEDEPCVLLLQESLSCGLSPLEFECLEMSASFEDVVQLQFIPWEPSDYVNTGNGVRVYISVLASCTVQKFPEYLNNGTISPSRKYYALLQAMDFWGNEEISDLVVFHKIPTPSETVQEPSSISNKSKSSPSPNFGLVYVVSTRIKSGSNNLLSYHPSRTVFENHIQQLLFTVSAPLLVENDKEILLRRMAGSTTEEVEAQLRLFLQLKLFGPQSGDLDKILRYRSEKQVTQWMDKERAYCMNDALKRSLERNSEPISPLRKSFVEFLMISDNCAKTVLDFIVDLYPDL